MMLFDSFPFCLQWKDRNEIQNNLERQSSGLVTGSMCIHTKRNSPPPHSLHPEHISMDGQKRRSTSIVKHNRQPLNLRSRKTRMEYPRSEVLARFNLSLGFPNSCSVDPFGLCERDPHIASSEDEEDYDEFPYNGPSRGC